MLTIIIMIIFIIIGKLDGLQNELIIIIIIIIERIDDRERQINWPPYA